jgi:glycosyltransferase involved in cell wall biosynthesis
MSLRILHVTPYFTDAWAYGGIPRLATTLTTGLARRGHHVTVCTTDVCDRHSRLPTRADTPAPSSIDVYVFRNWSNRLAYELQLFTPIGLRGYLGDTPAQFDIAHIHGHRHGLELVAARWCRLRGVPYVSAPNGTAPRIERRQALKRVWDTVWGRRDLAAAAAVLAVSQAERAQLLAMGVEPQRIRVVPNPLDLDECAPPPARGSFRRQHNLGDVPLVVFLGKLTPRKRLDVVMAAMPHVQARAARLVVAGNDMGAGAAARRLASTLGIAERTTFVGLLTGRARLELLADADIVVYPSADEVFGLVPLEALLCGTPVVVADDSGCGEVISTLDGGQVVALGDSAALGAAIDRVLASPQAWRARAASGAAAAAERFGGPVVAEQVDALYREVLAR